jgi:branched-chain amino acid transport system substrate-binding protein
MDRIRWTRIATLAVSVACVIALAGCGSSSTSGNSSSGSSGSGADAPSNSASIPNGPIVFVGLEALSGPAVLPQQLDGLKMAVAELNKAGGILGHKVVLDIQSSVDAPSTIAGVEKAKSAGAAAIFGPVVTDNYFAALKNINEAEIPTVTYIYGAAGQNLGSPWAVHARTPPTTAFPTTVLYAQQHFHAKKIGVFYGQLSAEQDEATIMENAIKSTGATLTSSQSGSVTGTNFTPQVLGLKGSEAIVGAPYPAQMGIVAKEMAQNGINAPFVGDIGVGLGVEFGVVPASVLPNVYWSQDGCNPRGVPSNSPLGRWATRFTSTYKTQPDNTSAYNYDSVMMVAAAIRAIKSTDNVTLNKELHTMSYSGLCTVYHADSLGYLIHKQVIVHSPDGKKYITEATYTGPQVAAALNH